MSLNIEFLCDLDNVDTNGLVINDDNIFDYSNFHFIIKNEYGYSTFLADSSYLSTLDIRSFINILSNFRSDVTSEDDLFGNLGYNSVIVKNKVLTFSVTNYKEVYSFMSHNIELNDENIQDVIDIFEKLFEYKQKIEYLYVSYSDEEEIIYNNNIIHHD